MRKLRPMVISPEDDDLLDELADLLSKRQEIDPSERASRIVLLEHRLRDCLRELDALGLSEVGVHVSMSLHVLDKVGGRRTPDLPNA